jgi:Na+-transporting methylmalonyl-CoA/oxaloacetate decarboxylase gamma subunit
MPANAGESQCKSKGVTSMNQVLIFQALEVMWKGMLSIFVVIIVLTLLVYGINKLLKEKDS